MEARKCSEVSLGGFSREGIFHGNRLEKFSEGENIRGELFGGIFTGEMSEGNCLVWASRYACRNSNAAVLICAIRVNKHTDRQLPTGHMLCTNVEVMVKIIVTHFIFET